MDILILLNILLIAGILTLIVDISGFNDTYKQIVGKLLKSSPNNVKGLCTLCLTWWSGLIYILLTGHLTFFNIFYILFIASLTPQIKDILMLFGDIIQKIINKIYDHI